MFNYKPREYSNVQTQAVIPTEDKFVKALITFLATILIKNVPLKISTAGVIRLTKSKKFCCCLDGCLLFLFNETFT
jgi:hypothetical protein